METGKWTAHIYDYETKKFEVNNCDYIRIGKMYFMLIYTTMPTVTFNTMMQVWNLPCDVCLGGSVYIAGLSDAGGTRVVQSSTNAYFRPNITGSFSGGAVSIFLVGMDN